MSTAPEVCGSTAGYSAHRRRAEPICEPCSDAWKKYCADYHAANSDKARVRKAAQYAAHPERWREQKLLRFGLTLAAHDALLASQGGGCAICGTDDPGGRGSFHVDHDHSCCPSKDSACGKCVRGLLCQGCNTGLGLFRDEPTRLKNAIQYLNREA